MDIHIDFKEIIPTLSQLRELTEFLDRVHWLNLKNEDTLYFSSNSSTARYDFKVHFGAFGTAIILEAYWSQ